MSESSMSRPPLTRERVGEMARGFQAARVLLTAHELGVFEALAAGAASSALVAQRLGTDPRATDRLLNALVVLRLVEKSETGVFSNAGVATECLVQTSPGYMADLGHVNNIWDRWSTMTAAVRAGTAPGIGQVNDRGAEWLAAFITAMHAIAADRPARVAAMLGLDGVRRVLDVGGGSGAYAMGFVRASATVQATVFDLPNVIHITRGFVETAGLLGRVALTAGDYNTDELPGGQDLVWLSAIIHSNSPGENEALLARCARATAPGGRVVVQDFIVDELRTAPPNAVMFALNMLVGTAAGDTFTEEEVAGWMRAAGLAPEGRMDTDFGTALIIARKPV